MKILPSHDPWSRGSGPYNYLQQPSTSASGVGALGANWIIPSVVPENRSQLVQDFFHSQLWHVMAICFSVLVDDFYGMNNTLYKWDFSLVLLFFLDGISGRQLFGT